jgi:hypothetical protein
MLYNCRTLLEALGMEGISLMYVRKPLTCAHTVIASGHSHGPYTRDQSLTATKNLVMYPLTPIMDGLMLCMGVTMYPFRR